MSRLFISLLLCLQLLTSGFAQEAPPPKAPKPTEQKPVPAQEPGDLDVVKITTNLVQIDAVVTDSSGKKVSDLRPDEVEMLEDGKPQKITNFSYITVDGPAVARPVNNRDARDVVPPPPRRLRPEEVNRTIALVVDDLGLSFESIYYTRQALKKFLDQQMQPNDLVAIIRTAGGIGALQQFTSDKRQLYSAIEKVKWYPAGRGGISAFAPIRASPLRETEEQREAEQRFDDFREDLFAVGTLGALNYVIRGLRELPGRKSVILVSDGLRIFTESEPNGSPRVVSAMRMLLDMANRASVVINTMDARGLPTVGLTAADSTAGRTPEYIMERLDQRRQDLYESQQSLNYLASQTGGLAIRNTNDLGSGIRRIMEDQSSYYLIGYRPDESTFDRVNGRSKFHRLSLKIKRPGKYNVRMRTGFLGISDENFTPPAPQTPRQQLISALVSPFSSSGVQLRLTSLFGNDAKLGSIMRSFLHVKASDLTFTKEPDGSYKSVIDVLAVTFGDSGAIVEQTGFQHAIGIKESRFKQVMQHGFTYNVVVPVKKTGAYQLRVALRDQASGKVGSAAQFITVPEFKKDRLSLSGLLTRAMPYDRYAKTGGASTAPDADNDMAQESDPATNTAVRQFKKGMALVYGFFVYNAKLDKSSGKPKLTEQVRLYRNNEVVFTGNEIPVDIGNQTDLSRIGTGGGILLGTSMVPGEYVLQVVVTDLLANDKRRTVTQWMDFEIVQ